MTGYSNRDTLISSSEERGNELHNEDVCHGAERHSRQQLLNLLQTVESDVIPRLVETHRQVSGESDASADAQLSLTSEIDNFARVLIHHEFQRASDFIKSLRRKGASDEILYLELLSPAARRLGEMWEEDLCSFTEVTIGVGRLQEILREISTEIRYSNQKDTDKRILLTPITGEQHTFGMSMLIEFFYRAGWEVWGWPGVSEQNLLQLVKNEWFHLVGLSMFAEIHTDAMISTIDAIRKASRNPSINIMVGGYAFASNPELVDTVGADAFANNATVALQQAEKLCEQQ